MLTADRSWALIAEVNPPELPDMTHLELRDLWRNVVVTDNVFGRIAVSPYAYAARLTHDVPGVHPTVVVSTRDRNIRAIESEVRGAVGNGVDSFLVVNGDTLPHVDHLARHTEIVTHLRVLQDERHLANFEVGSPTRFQARQYRQRIDQGAQFLVAGPVVDPAAVVPAVGRLGIRDDDPPLYLMASPPFSVAWVNRLEQLSGVATTSRLKARLGEHDAVARRELAWSLVREIEARARDSGCGGLILTGLKFRTVVNEAAAQVGSRTRAMIT